MTDPQSAPIDWAAEYRVLTIARALECFYLVGADHRIAAGEAFDALIELGVVPTWAALVPIIQAELEDL